MMDVLRTGGVRRMMCGDGNKLGPSPLDNEAY